MSHASHSLTGQKVCCNRSALNPEAGFCNDCGKPLLRCMASSECGSLLDDTGICPICVNPILELDAGAATTVRVGGKLAVPLTITNSSPVGRPLFVTGLWIKEDDGDLRPVNLPFKRLEPNAKANVSVRTGVLDYVGVHQVDLRIAVSTRYQWREENYVFSSGIVFPVESKDPSGSVTNVNVTAEQVGAGFTLYNPTRIESDRAQGVETSARSVPLKIVRADLSETEFGLRGYKNGLQVPRDVRFLWSGFAEDNAPFDGPILKPSGLLCFGRNAVNRQGGGTDVRLLVTKDGELDKPLSLTISRQHFTLYTESGRLMVRADSQFGLRINKYSLARSQVSELQDGDVIYPLRKRQEALALKLEFECEHETVTSIRITRVSQ